MKINILLDTEDSFLHDYTEDLIKNIKKIGHEVYFFKDHKKIQRRMDVVARLYKKRKLPVVNLKLSGKNKWQQIFSSLLIADWAAYYTAMSYKLEPEEVPMVEEFKKMI